MHAGHWKSRDLFSKEAKIVFPAAATGCYFELDSTYCNNSPAGGHSRVGLVSGVVLDYTVDNGHRRHTQAQHLSREEKDRISLGKKKLVRAGGSYTMFSQRCRKIHDVESGLEEDTRCLVRAGGSYTMFSQGCRKLHNV